MEPVFRLLHMPGMLKNMSEYSYRIATQNDIQAIAYIYNAAVIRGGSSADITPRTYEQRKAWVESHHDPYAVFVTETADDDGERQIIGFSALSDPQWQGRGVGTYTLTKLLEECRKRNMRKACGIIFADNAGSIALMKRFGFTQFGLMPTAATDSTGTMRDMSYWYLDL